VRIRNPSLNLFLIVGDPSSKLKPEIPERGNDNIPIKHEIEFDYRIEN
jgi:hypothetical protein